MDEITSPTMHHSFRPPLFDLKSVRLLVEVISSPFLIKNEIQKQNLCKFLYDIAKIVFGTVVISQVFKPPEFRIWIFISGLITTVVFFLFAYILDGKELQG